MDYLLDHMVRNSAERFPEKEALVHGGHRLTYAQVEKMVSALAHGLNSAGLERGDRVGILLDPSIQQVIAIFGALRAGAVFVPINHLLYPEQVAHILADCRVKALITTGARLSGLSSVFKRVPSLSFVVGVGGEEVQDIELPLHPFEDLSNVFPTSHRNRCIGNDLAALLYTSGSTGRPKGVMLTHAQIM